MRQQPKAKIKPEYAAATARARTKHGVLRCEVCRKPILNGHEQRHHKTKRSQGGDSTAANLATLCLVCHNAEHGIRVKGTR